MDIFLLLTIVVWTVSFVLASYWYGFRKGRGVGYTKGAEDVLEEWKKYINEMEDD